MIDLKYHVASLAAVFLALAAGILIGTSMVSTSAVENQIRRLKAGFDQVQAENRQLGTDNETLREHDRTLEKALQQVVPAAVRGHLEGKRIAILVSGNTGDAGMARELKLLLTWAGASVGSITLFGANLLPENPVSRQILVERAALDPQDWERARRQLASLVVREGVLGRNVELVKLVAQYSPGVLFDGDYSLPIDAAVLFASSGSQEDARGLEEGTSLQARIADALREQPMPTVACERQKCPVSLVPHFARYHLSTVDGIDTPLGKIALVYALGGKRGHYGTKPAAEKLLPDLDPLETAEPTRPQQGAHTSEREVPGAATPLRPGGAARSH